MTAPVPAHALVLGAPARRVGWMCACGERLGDALECSRCAERYVETDSGLALASDSAAEEGS